MTTVFIVSPTGSSSYTVPSDWISSDNSVEVIGGGGGGPNSAGYGGGGGAYAKITNLTLTPGASVTIGIGAGGATGSVGGDTWFNGASLAAPPSVGAQGGKSTLLNGDGGFASASVGTVKYDGGKGGAPGSYTGGGGGAASKYGAGKAGGAGGTGNTSGGGGAAGGGSVGAAGTDTVGGAGGHNDNGTDGGATGAAGAGRNGFVGAGGGGGYSGSQQGGAGAPGREYLSTLGVYAGAGGGGGGEYTDGTPAGVGGNYGGGGGSRRGAVGAQGIIVLTYGEADTTAPTLTSPTGTKTGATTASGTVSTNEAGGTLYRLASTNATETAATVKAAALTTAVTATGAQPVAFTGLAPGTTYYAHYVHRDAAGNDSARVSSASFTTDAAPATATTLSGPSGGQVGVASAPFTVGANGAITGTITVTPSDGGGGGTFSPTSVNISAGSPTGTFTYTPGSAGAKTIGIADTGGLTDAAPVPYTATLLAGNFTSAVLKNNTGAVLASKVLTYFRLYDPTTGHLVVSKTGLSTNGSGIVAFSDGAVVAGTTYKCDWLTDEGHYRMPSAEAT